MVKLSQFIKSDKLTFVLRFLLGALILYAEVPKLWDIEKLSVYAVYSYNFFPMHPVNIARFMGLIGPYIGVLIGLGLVFGVLTRLSALGWIIMCLLFIVMKADLIFIQHLIQPCHCFPGFLSNLLVTQTIWIDIVSIPLCLQIILANRERKFLAAWSLLPEKWRQSWLRYIW
ncbi:MAG: MauE/DoxX family redox-associated membrane protein [Dehalococcoidales bacterium]|jgi:uncharacterized membrane protein YphA (DoxX/SURF4 family)